MWPEAKEREHHHVGLTMAAKRRAETVLDDLGKLGVEITLDEAGKMRVRSPRGISPGLVGPVIERHGDLIEAYLREQASRPEQALTRDDEASRHSIRGETRLGPSAFKPSQRTVDRRRASGKATAARRQDDQSAPAHAVQDRRRERGQERETRPQGRQSRRRRETHAGRVQGVRPAPSCRCAT